MCNIMGITLEQRAGHFFLSLQNEEMEREKEEDGSQKEGRTRTQTDPVAASESRNETCCKV